MKIDQIPISGTYQSAVSQNKETVETDAFKDLLKTAAEGKDLKKLKEASQEFEAYFINMLFKEMRKTIQEGGLVEKSQARSTFENMLDEEMSKNMSKQGGLGLADMIYNNMVRVYSNTSIKESEDAIETQSKDTHLDVKG